MGRSRAGVKVRSAAWICSMRWSQRCIHKQPGSGLLMVGGRHKLWQGTSATAMAFGYFDDTCPLPSLMAPPYHIFVWFLPPTVPLCIPGSKNGRQVIRKQDIKTGWDTMGQSGTGDRNIRPLGDSSDTTEPEFGKNWDNMGSDEKNSAPFFPKRTPHCPPRFCPSRIAALDFLCSHPIRPAKCEGPGPPVSSSGSGLEDGMGC